MPPPQTMRWRRRVKKKRRIHKKRQPPQKKALRGILSIMTHIMVGFGLGRRLNIYYKQIMPFLLLYSGLGVWWGGRGCVGGSWGLGEWRGGGSLPSPAPSQIPRWEGGQPALCQCGGISLDSRAREPWTDSLFTASTSFDKLQIS